MKETIKIIRLESLPALVLIAAAFASVGCASQKNTAATRTASTPNSAANVARTPEAESSGSNRLRDLLRRTGKRPSGV